MKKTALILEGGGFRSLFTAGILDVFLENNLEFPYVIGVSAGASMGASFVSRQIGRNKRVTVDFVNDSRYMGFRNLLTTGSIFSRDFIFNTIPNELEPFDYETYFSAVKKYTIVATNCETGDPEYFDAATCSRSRLNEYLYASICIPFVSKPFKIGGSLYLDGGISDSIPVEKSIRDGNEKHLVILTRSRNYRKKKINSTWLVRGFYRNYPKLAKRLIQRSERYNATLELIEKLENAGDAFVFRPLEGVNVKRLEKNKQLLEALYREGRNQAGTSLRLLKRWLNRRDT